MRGQGVDGERGVTYRSICIICRVMRAEYACSFWDTNADGSYFDVRDRDVDVAFGFSAA